MTRKFTGENPMKKSTALIVLTILLFISLFTAACSTDSTPVQATETATQTSVPTDPPGGVSTEPALEDQVIITPTPRPTATPGAISELVERAVQAAGLEQTTFLGLTSEDWVNLLISIAIFLLGAVLVIRLAVLLFKRLARMTPTQIDDTILVAILPALRIFILALFLDFAIQRLAFIPASWKQTSNQVYQVVVILVVTFAIWRMIDVFFELQLVKRGLDRSSKQATIVLPILRLVVRITLVFVAGTVTLNIFGVNVGALVAVLGIGGLAISLAAQDTLSDFISGIIILMDQPYREGDRIEINQLGTWGDVMQIGARTTRIRTRDNRMVIVPNSQIGKSQIVNYTYPDPVYRIETMVSVAYGSDLDLVDTTIIGGIRSIYGVLADRPIDVLVTELGDFAINLRVRWWINSYTDTRQIVNQVNRVLITSLDQAGIIMPNATYDINLRFSDDNANRIVKALRGSNPENKTDG